MLLAKKIMLAMSYQKHKDKSCFVIDSLQTILSTFGIETQTPQQIEPIQIWPPSQLILVSENKKY